MPDAVQPQTWVPEAWVPEAWVPDACTLPTVEQPLRVAAFDDLLGRAVSAVEENGPAGVADRLRR